MNELQGSKHLLRRQAYDARQAQPRKDEVSRHAIARLVRLPEYQAARTVMWYIDCRSELRTQHTLPEALGSEQADRRALLPQSRPIARSAPHGSTVPHGSTDAGVGQTLGLWLLESMRELVVGTWKILEPPRERWGESGKEIAPQELDFIMVPGVGFGRDGERIGNGQGYYDRLLQRVRADCPAVAPCYESQLLDEIVMGPHDVYMDKVVTEAHVYDGMGRRKRRGARES